jgi:hypothetical protein
MQFSSQITQLHHQTPTPVLPQVQSIPMMHGFDQQQPLANDGGFGDFGNNSDEFGNAEAFGSSSNFDDWGADAEGGFDDDTSNDGWGTTMTGATAATATSKKTSKKKTSKQKQKRKQINKMESSSSSDSSSGSSSDSSSGSSSDSSSDDEESNSTKTMSSKQHRKRRGSGGGISSSSPSSSSSSSFSSPKQRTSDVAREVERFQRWKESLTNSQLNSIQPSASYDDSLFYSSMEFLEALKRSKTSKFFDCQLMDRMYLRVQGSLSKTWIVADFKLSDATLLAFKVGKNVSDEQPESGWWRDTSRVPIKSLPLSKDLVLEPMILEDSNNRRGQRMFTSKLVDTRTKKTVLRVSAFRKVVFVCVPFYFVCVFSIL